jgi:hypothetical protein
VAAEKTGPARWQNWAGNQSCVAREFATPASGDDVSYLVQLLPKYERFREIRNGIDPAAGLPECLLAGSVRLKVTGIRVRCADAAPLGGAFRGSSEEPHRRQERAFAGR